MKNRGLIIITIIFSLTISTSYYWEGKLGLLAFPAFIFLVVVYFGLVIALIRQTYLAVKEKLSNKSRLITIGFLALVLTITFIKPFGIIDLNKLEGENLLTAQREGAANCTTTFKLKDNFTFKERNVCFGVSEVKGTWSKVGQYFNDRPCGKWTYYGENKNIDSVIDKGNEDLLLKLKTDTVLNKFITK